MISDNLVTAHAHSVIILYCATVNINPVSAPGLLVLQHLSTTRKSGNISHILKASCLGEMLPLFRAVLSMYLYLYVFCPWSLSQK